jgi:hypothetical protein
LTKAGTASGATSSTCHTRRAGTEERSTSHAAPTPRTAQQNTVPATSRVVFQSSSPTRGRKTSSRTPAQPTSIVEPAM